MTSSTGRHGSSRGDVDLLVFLMFNRSMAKKTGEPGAPVCGQLVAPSPPECGLDVFVSHVESCVQECIELKAHLKPLEATYKLRIRCQCSVGAGNSEEARVSDDLARSPLVIGLTSAQSFDSMRRDYDKKRSDATFIEVNVLPCERDEKYAEWRRLPKSGRAVSESPERDAAWTDVVGDLRGVIESILSKTGKRTAVEVPSACPFTGLAAFGEDRANFFFGRENEVAAARLLLGETEGGHGRWLQVDGESGVGKSSLVRAGLVPAIRAHGIKGGPARLRVAVIRPGQDLVLSLARDVHQWLKDVPAMDTSSATMVNDFRTNVLAFSDILSLHAGDSGFLLVIDQFEEALVPRGRDQAMLSQFDALLTNALGNTDTCLYLITTLRSDFVDLLLTLPKLNQLRAPSAACYSLLPMDVEGLRAAIERPAEIAGRPWAADLVSRILTDASKSKVGLPLVAHILQVLWTGGSRTHEAYTSLGGVEGALVTCADATLARLNEEGKEQARKLLLRLVKVGRETRHMRQEALRDDMIELSNWSVFNQLSRQAEASKPVGSPPAPLALIVSSKRDEKVYVDLVHESLLQQWTTLRVWIREGRQWMQRRDELEDTARIWEAMGRNDNGLPEDPELSYFRKAEGHGKLAQEFLAKAEERNRWLKRSRQAHVAILVLTLTVFVAVLGKSVLATHQRRVADQRLKGAVDVAVDLVTEINGELAAVEGATEARKTLGEKTTALVGKLLPVGGDGEAVLSGLIKRYRGEGLKARKHSKWEETRRRYEAVLPVAQLLKDRDSSNVTYQSNFALIYDDLGDVDRAGGDLSAARVSYEKGFNLRSGLLRSNPQSHELQHSICISYNKLGVLAKAEGETSLAYDFLALSAKGQESLMDSTPHDATVRRELSRAYEKLSEVEEARGNLTTARELLEKGLALRESLRREYQPDNQVRLDLTRELARGYFLLGTVSGAVGDTKAASDLYEKGLSLRTALAQKNPLDDRVRCELFDDVAEVARAEGDSDKARTFFEMSLEVRRTLSKQDPTDVSLTRDVANGNETLGDVAAGGQDFSTASIYFDNDLALRETLARADPRNIDLQIDLIQCHRKLAELANTMNDVAALRIHRNEGLTMIANLEDNARGARDARIAQNRKILIGFRD